jgi:Signal transduction histidine kinase
MKICSTIIYRFIAILLFQLTFFLNVWAVKFYSVNSLYGISNRVTASICKDDNGFIWASSKTGILRLSETDYRIYQLPYESSGAIFVKLIYRNSELFAYTNNGQIFVYNKVIDRFDLLVNLKRIVDNDKFDVYSLLVDNSGFFWIALNNGLYKYRSGEIKLIEEIHDERYNVDWFDKENLIIAKPSGIWSLNIKTLNRKCLQAIKDIRPFLVSSLYLDKTYNKLWIGTFSNGLYNFEFATSRFSRLHSSTFPTQPILAIEENSESTLLVGIDGQGVWELDKRDSHILNIYKENVDDPYSLRGNGVYDIFYEKGRRVWFCTYSGGVSFYELASPHINEVVHHTNDANSLVNNDVNAIIEDHDGKIWFATNNGISRWDMVTGQWHNFYYNKLEQAQVFLTLCEDDQGRIWAGSYSSGIYVLDGKTGRELAHYSRNEKDMAQVSNYIFDIFKDSQGDLWIGGVNGKFLCFLSKENRFRIYSDESISSLDELSPNQILLGCSNAIKLLDKNTGGIKVLLSNFVVQDVQVVGDIIWVCTSGRGLLEFNYKNGVVNSYTTKDGLPSNFLNSIIYTDNNLWVGTESGLFRFDPKDKTAYTYSSIVPLSGVSYNKSAVCALRDGQLVWGTNNGAVFFTPQSIREISSKGKIFFQDITISGRSIRELPSIDLNCPVDSLKTLNLKYAQNTISLELIPVGMKSGSKFSWILEGFDKNWSTPSKNRMITYTNLPSGKFTLKVKLYDNSVTNIVAERSISIRLVPPFWRTGWFWIIIIIVVTSIMVLYLLYYINRLKQLHTEEKVRFFTNTAHDIRTSLTLIKAPVEELYKESSLTESGKYYLNLAIEQARQLSAVVTQLMDFQKVDVGKEPLSLTMVDIVKLVEKHRIMLATFGKSKNIELQFITDRDNYTSAVDEQKMAKIIDNLISNAIKYSHENSQIQIDLKCDDKKWILQVKDNGIGISKKAQRQLFKEFYRADNAINSKVVGSGIGLLLVKNYVNMHDGKISCTSQENIGSTFQIVIPYKLLATESAVSGTKDILTAETAPIKEAVMPVDVKAEIQSQKEMKVLVVEDNDDLLNFMKVALSSDFKVFSAVDGEKAWEFISKQFPDLVVSDIMMPNMDGFELCKLIKSTYETSHIPIVLLTALSEVTDQLHGLGLGADDYLTKPFDMNILTQKIKSIIRNRKVVRDKALKLIKADNSENILENELNDKFVKKMLEVARANISNAEFSKDDFALAMNVSASLLYKKIKSLTDQSPTDFIKVVRLNYALELLQTRKYTVTEVSEMCGFASVSYFSTVFKKHYGKSPTEILE